MYLPSLESIKAHKVPDWYHDAKLGIMIQWSLSSVPGFAPVGDKDIMEMFRVRGLAALEESPYSEWYQNSMKFKNKPTWKFHVETYGQKFSYTDFQPLFEKEAEKVDFNEWATLFKDMGARYVNLITKHHDGYCLWPTNVKNKHIAGFCSRRDFVGELAQAVRAHDMRLALYYSGVYDWSYLHIPMNSLYTFTANMAQGKAYIEYANAQIRELIDRYEPSILWNDIAYPHGTDLNEIFAYYYNKVEDGLVNDRWNQNKIPKGPIGKLLMKMALNKVERKMLKSIGGDAVLGLQAPRHFDFRTPEYSSFDEITDYKWETVRGIGKSFGYNRNESEKDVLSAHDLAVSFADVVSKNGNLLIGLGPKADGTIPEVQLKPLLELGSWLKDTGEAFFGTRPWVRASAKTDGGIDVRYTAKDNVLYATLLGKAEQKRITIEELKTAQTPKVELLGSNEVVACSTGEKGLDIILPKNMSDQLAAVFRITGATT